MAEADAERKRRETLMALLMGNEGARKRMADGGGMYDSDIYVSPFAPNSEGNAPVGPRGYGFQEPSDYIDPRIIAPMPRVGRDRQEMTPDVLYYLLMQLQRRGKGT